MAEYVDSATVLVDLRVLGFDNKFPSPGQPANDHFADAVVLSTTLPGSRDGDTNKDSTWEAGEKFFSQSGGGDQSVWYKFIPATTGYYQFMFSDVDNNADTTSAMLQLLMYKGTTLAHGEDNLNWLWVGHVLTGVSSPTSNLSAPVVAYMESGVTYYLKVYSPTNIGLGQDINGFTVSWDLGWSLLSITPPANDNFDDAEVINSFPDTVSGTTFNATAELGEWPRGFGYQSVWYKIVIASTGVYKIRFPASSLVAAGTGTGEYAHVAFWNGAGVTTVDDLNDTSTQFITSLTLDEADTNDGVIIEQLAAGDYYVQVYSPTDITSGFGQWNRRSLNFDMEVSQLPPVDNDDFDNAEPISGASGSITFVTAGSSFQTGDGEPDSYYWNGPGQTRGTVWFDWTCPATGDYVFKVEATEDDALSTQPSIDLAVWQGTDVGALTKVRRQWAGSQNDEGRVRSAATAVGFSAVNGQSYKIQITNWVPAATSDMKLTWNTNTVTGDTAASAVTSLPNGRINNYGNTDNDLPPDYLAIMGDHQEWWFTTPIIGSSKWYKTTITADQTINISGRMWDGLTNSPSNAVAQPDVGLIVYKGADYGSLVVAEAANAAGLDACMMLGPFVYDGSVTRKNVFTTKEYGSFPTSSDGSPSMDVDCEVGDVVWICLFSIVESGETWVDSLVDELDTAHFEVDLAVLLAAPENDDYVEFAGVPYVAYPYHIGRSPWGSYFNGLEADWREGTTAGATFQSPEPATAGFAATRSVWYFIEIPSGGDYKFWVESSVDCVLGLYDDNGTNGIPGTLMGADDDSGPGNNPEFTVALSNGDYWLKVDSKTEGGFRVFFQKQSSGTPPANDDFADATVISSLPFSQSGTTVDATAEPYELEAEELSFGPKDTVWYKYVATFNGHVKVKATCDSQNNDWYIYVDSWKGTTLENLVRNPEPPPTGPGGGFWRGFFAFGDTPAENELTSFTFDVVNGETYYIRVQTESGGSEDFTIYVDGAAVYLDLQASGSEEFHGTIIDDAEIYLNLLASGIDEGPDVFIDAATILVDLQASGVDIKAFQYVDSATAYLDITPEDSHECYFHLEPSFNGDGVRKWAWNESRKWAFSGSRRWTWVEGEGQPQVC